MGLAVQEPEEHGGVASDAGHAVRVEDLPAALELVGIGGGPHGPRVPEIGGDVTDPQGVEPGSLGFPEALLVVGLAAEPAEAGPAGELVQAGDHDRLPVYQKRSPRGHLRSLHGWDACLPRGRAPLSDMTERAYGTFSPRSAFATMSGRLN